MSTLTILDGDEATLWFHPEAGIVHHRFKQPARGAELRRVFESGLELFVAHGARKWLSDDRANYALSPEDAEWARDDWAPRVAAAGWDYWAIVLPKSVVGTMDMQTHMEHGISLGVDVQVFSDPLLALAWLKSV
jgi:hypothetical protein